MVVAWRHQAIIWTNVDLSSGRSGYIHLMLILVEIPQLSITKISLKIACLKFHWNLPGANELAHWGWHFADISRCIFLNENFCVLVSLKFIPKGSIGNKSSLFQVMAWQWTGEKPLLEAMITQVYDNVWQPYASVRLRQNGRCFADNNFKRIFLNENVRISNKISLKFVPKGPISNNPALVHIMAWRRSGDKPLSEPMMVSLLTHICITRPQWTNAGLADMMCSI